jgi:Tol biopolymer transport system component
MSKRSGKEQIWAMRAEGSQQRRLFVDEGNDYNPSWGPELAYETDRHGSNHDEIYVDEHRVTNDDAHDIFPTWTKAGALIFSSNRTLVTMNIDGTDRADLVPDAFFGVMAPNGKALAFIRGRWPESKLFIANADGSSPRVAFPR